MGTEKSWIRHVVGVMTGTSIDGLDAALVRIEGCGLDMHASLIRHISASLGDLQEPLRKAAEQVPMTAGEFATLAWDFGCLHAEIISELVADGENPDLISVHGQTVFHKPPVSWQLINPAPIEHRFKCPVISDLRQADLAAGGQGAPITPFADWVMFRHPEKARAVINLGGFCNVTILTQDVQETYGFDVCVCNQLLNNISAETLQRPFDEDGLLAADGAVHDQACNELIAMLAAQHQVRRSLGTGDESFARIEKYKSKMSPNDLLATSVRGIATVIAQSINERGIAEAIVAGGGVRNLTLCSEIACHAQMPVTLSDKLGIPAEAREASAMAILATLRTDGVAITRHTTGEVCLPGDAAVDRRKVPCP